MSQLDYLINQYNHYFELSKNVTLPRFPLSYGATMNNEYVGSDEILEPYMINYNDKMVEIFDQIKNFYKKESFATITDYISNVDKLNTSESIYKYINDKKNTSYNNLQNSKVILMKWIFLLLFVLSISFQMFENTVLKSASIVSFIGAIIVLLNILKILNSIIFSVVLLSLLSAIVLLLFFKKMYAISICVLLFGMIGCNFYMNYKGI